MVRRVNPSAAGAQRHDDAVDGGRRGPPFHPTRELSLSEVGPLGEFAVKALASRY